MPAPILRWGVSLFDPEVRPSQVSGNTVVSSIYRVPTDLRLGDAPVLLTAVYPGLSPAMGLTHGVWGVGDMVTVSVHAAESAVGDIDGYVARLEAELYRKRLSIIGFAGPASGQDQLLMQLEPHGVVRVDQRSSQPHRLAGMDIVQCRLQLHRVAARSR